MPFSAGYIGIDLGTCFTRIVAKNGREVAFNEPTLVLLEDSKRRTVLAIGNDAKEALSHGSKGFIPVHPVKDGVLTDYESAISLLKYAVRRAIGSSYIIKPKLFISIPGCISDIDKRALLSAANAIGGNKNIHLIEKSFLAALGSGLPVWEVQGQMIVDIGGGTTDIAVISLGGIVIRHSVRVGGNVMNESISCYVEQKYNLKISDTTAEALKTDLGSPLEQNSTVYNPALGMNKSGLVETFQVSNADIREAILAPCDAIVEAIKWVLERTPPDLVVDIMEQGIFLTGGGSQLSNIDQYISNKLKVSVQVSQAVTAQKTTISGLGLIIENLEKILAQGTAGFFAD